jgi:hypothetical protein
MSGKFLHTSIARDNHGLKIYCCFLAMPQNREVSLDQRGLAHGLRGGGSMAGEGHSFNLS